METIGPLEKCDKSQVSLMAKTAKEMIQLSVKSLEKLDKNASQKLYMMDDSVDSMFRNYLKKAVTQNKRKGIEPKCYASTLLILRYLERISDHACYIGDIVHYVVTGDPSPRR
jgi:phosphate transport system protein